MSYAPYQIVGAKLSKQKFRKLLNFRNANHSTENSRNSGSKVQNGNKENFREKKSKIWVSRLSSFLEIFRNRYWKLRKIHVLGRPCSTRESYSSPFNIWEESYWDLHMEGISRKSSISLQKHFALLHSQVNMPSRGDRCQSKNPYIAGGMIAMLNQQCIITFNPLGF